MQGLLAAASYSLVALMPHLHPGLPPKAACQVDTAVQAKAMLDCAAKFRTNNGAALQIRVGEHPRVLPTASLGWLAAGSLRGPS